MAKLRIEEILKEKSRSRYWLAKEMGMHYISLKKLIEGSTTSIRFDTLDSLSRILDVPVSKLWDDKPVQ